MPEHWTRREFSTGLTFHLTGGHRPGARLGQGEGAVRVSEPAGAGEPGAARHSGGATGAAVPRERAQDRAPHQLHAHRPAEVRTHQSSGCSQPLDVLN